MFLLFISLSASQKKLAIIINITIPIGKGGNYADTLQITHRALRETIDTRSYSCR